MELVYVTVIGAGIGLVLRYLLPNRGSYGILLLPAVGAVATAAVWVGLVWLGLTFDGGWIWVIALAAAAVASVAVAIAVPIVRRNADERALAEAARP